MRSSRKRARKSHRNHRDLEEAEMESRTPPRDRKDEAALERIAALAEQFPKGDSRRRGLMKLLERIS